MVTYLCGGENNVTSPWEIAIGSDNNKIWIKCANKDKMYHGEYEIAPYNFKIGKGCPFCNNKQIHYLDSLASKFVIANKLWSEKNNKTPFEYSPVSGRKVWWKCDENKHQDYKRSVADSNKAMFKCPDCVQERKESYLQEKIRNYLNENYEYELKHEFDCSIVPVNTITKHKMPMDNEIKLGEKTRLFIECHGKQHYEINGFTYLSIKESGRTPEEEFAYQQWKDEYKKQYVISQGYEYLAIPYWEDDSDEIYKKSIDNKIQEILTKQNLHNI